MSETKSIIRALLDCNVVEHYRSMTRASRVRLLMSRFGCSAGVARNVSNCLSIYGAEELFHIYYKELFDERN